MEENPVSADKSKPVVQNEKRWYEIIPPFSILMYLQRKLKIGPKLVIGFGLLIALMLVGSGLGISSSNRAILEIDRTTNLRAPTALVASQAQANLLELVADLQAYLALGDSRYKDKYAADRAQFESNLYELDAIINQSGARRCPET